MTIIHLDSGYDIEIQSSGHLACKQDNTVWDKHVKLVIVNNLDAFPLWTDITESFDLLHKDTYTFMVPYMPEMEIFVQVELEEAVSTGRVIYLISPLDGTRYRIGVLFPGEGRNIVRNLIHQWFIVQTSGPMGPELRKKCIASSHKPKQQEILEHNLKNKKALGEQWLLLFTNMCYACNVLKQQASSFVPNF